jgi:hypothetical protein
MYARQVKQYRNGEEKESTHWSVLIVRCGEGNVRMVLSKKVMMYVEKKVVLKSKFEVEQRQRKGRGKRVAQRR